MGKKLIKTIIDSPENVANAIRLALQKKSTISELIEVESDSSFIGWAGVDSNDTALLNTLESIKVGDVINLVARKQTGNKPLMFTTNSNAENELRVQRYSSDETLRGTFYYSYDGIEWTKWERDYITLPFSKARPLYIKGDNPDGMYYMPDETESDPDSENLYHCQFHFDKSEPVYCSGNIMSLLGEDITEIPCEYCFKDLFRNCKALVTAPELPAIELTDNCYDSMFYGCSSLVTAPALPATTLAEYCYENMFNGCTALKQIVTYQSGAPDEIYNRNWVSSIKTTGTMYAPNGARWAAITAGDDTYPSTWTLVKSAPPAA